MWLRNRSSIKSKVVAISTICSAVSLFIAAAAVIVVTYFRTSESIIEMNSLIADIVGFHAGAALVFDDPESGNQMLNAFSSQPAILSANISSTDGLPFSRYTSSRPGHSQLLAKLATTQDGLTRYDRVGPSGMEKSAVFSTDILHLTSPINVDGIRVGTLNMFIDLTPAQTRAMQIVIGVLFFLLLAFLLAYLLSNRLQRSVTGPIDDFAATIRNVSEGGDYTRRVKHITKDEIGALASNFNYMLQIIEDRDRKLEMLVAQLKLATEAKSAFLANMSHEIRTPMNGILGITSLLLDMPVSAKKRSYYKTIDTSAKSLMLLINGILDLSKIESGNFIINKASFNLVEVLDELQDLFESMAQQKNLQLSFSLAPDTPICLTGDSLRLRQVLINLIGNALKFTENGSIAISISASAMPQKASTPLFLFEVLDTGIGIPEYAQRRVFLNFIQGDGSGTRSYGGTGLGLAVSKNLVELMQGEIGVDSIEGRGSRFWFTLPLEQSSRQTHDQADDSSALAPPIKIKKSENIASGGDDFLNRDEHDQYQARILVVDDSEVNQFILIETLKTFGIDSVAVDSGAAAIAALQEDHFDLVVMDIQMPNMSGIEATATIRRLEKTMNREQTLPIIAFSANAMQGDRERFLRANMDDYLSKPMQREELAAILHKWLGHYRLSE